MLLYVICYYISFIYICCTIYTYVFYFKIAKSLKHKEKLNILHRKLKYRIISTLFSNINIGN